MRVPKRQVQPFTHRWAVGHPPAWAILIALNAAVFTVQQLMGPGEPDWIKRNLGLSDQGVHQGYVWQFITYTFLHAGWIHIGANMLMLYFAGRELEPLLGTRHFLGIYFGGGVLGGLAQWAFTPLPEGGPLMGASASVLATLIAFTTILPELDLTCLLFFVIPLRLKTKYLARVVVWSSILALLTPWLLHFIKSGALDRMMALVASHDFNFKVAHYAHLGGCLFGWLYVKQLGYGNPLRIQRYFLEKRLREERRKHMTSEQFMNEEIDPILEKISRDGIGSLTRAEKRILEMGREKITRDRH